MSTTPGTVNILFLWDSRIFTSLLHNSDKVNRTFIEDVLDFYIQNTTYSMCLGKSEWKGSHSSWERAASRRLALQDAEALFVSGEWSHV